ncbi:MAG: leucyl aminopeptidase [Chlamydiia bacterium]|nr:leucyl aminopeptidase [Chlamydiia bacterium]
MKITSVPSFSKRKGGDLCLVPFIQVKGKPLPAASIGKHTFLPIVTGDFKGKAGEVLLTHDAQFPEKRVLLVGLGPEKEVTIESLRCAYGKSSKKAAACCAQTLNVLVPSLNGLDVQNVLHGLSEGLFLAHYRFNHLRKATLKAKELLPLKQLNLVGVAPQALHPVKEAWTLAQAVYWTRDLVNNNADIVTPHYLANCAKALAKGNSKVSCRVFEEKQLKKEKLNLILKVGQGAVHPPVMIVLEYKGNPRSKEKTVLVGKGITYDTGGLNLKPSGFMEDMRTDMGGAGCCLGTFKAAVALGLKVNLACVVASAENAIDGNSYKPGDVYDSYAGKTVEIGNTDAEGRLVLADALAWSVDHLKPTRMIDVCTLTGAARIALGDHIASLMCDDECLRTQLQQASEATHERVWPLPLVESYRKDLDSTRADIKNIGRGRNAGTIIGGLFLKEFVDSTPWAHLDIASVADRDHELDYTPKEATGFGVRLLTSFLCISS